MRCRCVPSSTSTPAFAAAAWNFSKAALIVSIRLCSIHEQADNATTAEKSSAERQEWLLSFMAADHTGRPEADSRPIGPNDQEQANQSISAYEICTATICSRAAKK